MNNAGRRNTCCSHKLLQAGEIGRTKSPEDLLGASLPGKTYAYRRCKDGNYATARLCSREIVARSKGLTIFRGSGVRRDELDPLEVDRLGRELPLPDFDANKPPFRN